jgi:hypothetical protein
MKSFNQFISEAASRSFSRMHKHLEDDRTLGFVSASRGEHTPAENNEKTEELRKSLMAHGYSPVRVKGETIEDQNGKQVAVKEKSFMVHSGDKTHDEFVSDLTKHGKMFKQDSVLAVSRKRGSNFHYTRDTSDAPEGATARLGAGEFRTGPELEREQYKSRLKGRPFSMG